MWSVAFSPRGRHVRLRRQRRDDPVLASPQRSRPRDALHAGVGASFERVSYSPDGDTIAVGGENIAAGGANGKIRLWDVHTHQQVGTTLSGHNGGVKSVVFSPDGRTLASATEQGEFGTIRFWDGRARSETPGHEIRLPQTRDDDTCFPSLAFSQDESTLASAVADWTVRLWDVHDPTRVTKVGQMDHASEVCSVAFSPDGRTIASSGADGSIRLWDAHTQAFVAEPLIGGRPVRSLAFSPDGRMLASAGDDGTIRLWDVESGRQVGDGLPLGGEGRSPRALPSVRRAGCSPRPDRTGRFASGVGLTTGSCTSASAVSSAPASAAPSGTGSCPTLVPPELPLSEAPTYGDRPDAVRPHYEDAIRVFEAVGARASHVDPKTARRALQFTTRSCGISSRSRLSLPLSQTVKATVGDSHRLVVTPFVVVRAACCARRQTAVGGEGATDPQIYAEIIGRSADEVFERQREIEKAT